MSSAEIIEAEARDVTPPQPQAMVTLFGTDDPSTVVQRASVAARALVKVVTDQHLYAEIQGKRHLLVEAWTLLGSMTGVFGSTEWTRPVMDGQQRVGWEARVIARTMSGAVVGGAEAMCLRTEPRWSRADDYAIRSMAQTRALSKALSMPLRFIAQLGGFAGTPAEEMPHDPPANGATQTTVPHPNIPPARVTPAADDRLCQACAQLGIKSKKGYAPKVWPGKSTCDGFKDGQYVNHPVARPTPTDADR